MWRGAFAELTDDDLAHVARRVWSEFIDKLANKTGEPSTGRSCGTGRRSSAPRWTIGGTDRDPVRGPEARDAKAGVTEHNRTTATSDAATGLIQVPR